jgi:hypothetical protein
MSAKSISIPALLVGTHYRSISRPNEGTIVYASKREGLWYGENLEAYAIEVRPTYGLNNFWATIAVNVAK